MIAIQLASEKRIILSFFYSKHKPNSTLSTTQVFKPIMPSLPFHDPGGIQLEVDVVRLVAKAKAGSINAQRSVLVSYVKV